GDVGAVVGTDDLERRGGGRGPGGRPDQEKGGDDGEDGERDRTEASPGPRFTHVRASAFSCHSAGTTSAAGGRLPGPPGTRWWPQPVPGQPRGAGAAAG